MFTSRGRIEDKCLVQPKGAPINKGVFRTPPDYYERAECGSNGDGIEYIAQARAIARLNAMSPSGSKAGITP
ncbi:hypothetical protein, partial [Arthrobacter sp. M4]|uniref:hypothetical protein n=1 Tax=Arthrobacter sp. M4 TaxID=218160 RepID=UPI001CDD2652